MNAKMKKVVAGVVLGTFAFGAATPAFAATMSFNQNPLAVQETVVEVNSEHEVIVNDGMERGKITTTLKALKTLISNNKDTIREVLVALNIVQEKGFDNFYDKFMKGLDFVFDTNDTIEGVFTDALVNLGVDESLASTAASLLTHFLF